MPAVADLAAMRDAMEDLGGNPQDINPLSPVDLVIDHSVMVDYFGAPSSFEHNVDREYQRNQERYEFLRWGQTAFENFRVVPPGTGICHQVNLEHIAQTVWVKEEGGVSLAFPDTLVGTDSHTTMVNGLSVLGWGVGGIEAEAAMLGQPVSMLIPEVIGFRLTGDWPEGATATDLVLSVTEQLRAHGVVGKFVEFFGPGLDVLSLEDQATLANMAPEYGATCGFFPVDQDTLSYLTSTGRDPHRVKLVEAYAKAQGLYRDKDMPDPVFTDVLEFDLKSLEPCIAGPKRPQDRVPLVRAKTGFTEVLSDGFGKTEMTRVPVKGADYDLGHGDVVIAAITSCTNTSNPSVLVGAGLLARKAVEMGLKSKSWVKTSFAPGSQVVTDYLDASGLSRDLDSLGFNLVGYGCTTCIGNSGPLPEPVAKAVDDNDLVVCSALSGNRNFEGRISPHVRANYLASPPLVVAYALAGTMMIDFAHEPLGEDKEGHPVYLKDLWPRSEEIAGLIREHISPELFAKRYAHAFTGDERWQAMRAVGGLTYSWQETSTYVRRPPFFEGMGHEIASSEDVNQAHILGLFGDSITTDHISPAGAIKKDSPAGRYLMDHGVEPKDFNSYGSRRGNHEVMMRGTFANIRIKNLMLDGVEGGFTRHIPTDTVMDIYDAAMLYQKDAMPLVIFAGREYGTGSSRDWAAKGTRLLGVKAVIAESFERIHRSNLVGMGVLPLQFKEGESWKSLGLQGDEKVSLYGLQNLTPRGEVEARITTSSGEEKKLNLTVRIDTAHELDYYKNGGHFACCAAAPCFLLKG